MRVLLKNHFRMFMNTVKTQELKGYASYIISFAVLGILLYFVSGGIWSLADLITDPVLEGLLSYAFMAVIGLIVLLGTPQVFKHLFSMSDLTLLFTLPIKTRNIFWIKYMQSFVGIPLFASLFILLPAILYGIASGASYLFYPVLIFVLLAMVLIGLSLAYLFNLLLVQIVPASRANELMTVMSVFSGLIVYMVFMLPNMTGEQTLLEKMLAGLPLFPKWVPMTWGSHAILEAANGSMGFALPLLLLIMLAGIFIFITSSIVERGFRTGWIRLSEGSNTKKKKRNQKQTTKLHHPIQAVARKEWLAVKRDIREWLVLMPILFFIIFGTVGFLTGGGKLSSLQGYHAISWPIAQGVLLFIYAMSNGMVAASSIGREGAAMWILRLIPVSGRDLAFGKLLVSWLLPFILLTTIEVIIGVLLGWTIPQFVLGIVVKAVITMGISSLGLYLGTIGAKYHPTNPQQRLNFGVSILLMIVSYVYLILALLPFGYMILPVDEITLPANLDHGITGFKGMIVTFVLKAVQLKMSYPTLMWLVGAVVLLIIAGGITWLFSKLSARKLNQGIKIDIVNESSAKPLFGKRNTGGSLY
ncbi:putative ABC transporter permease subunit [Ornithinibacillus gellani]|uniref:putative ABC transporter permease subunit n=1 Tax=Ornithinibacillus gellani TaxID=2293253 RepID=UPI0016804127|nr:hypothetical protein [Ornithinibacillus gellani]